MRMLMRVYLVICPIPKLDVSLGPNTETWFRSYNNFACLVWKLRNKFWPNTHTLYNTILRIARNFLETRESIKISTHPFYHVNLDWFSWEWSKKKFFFWKKKSKMAVFQKWPFFKIANSQNFFVKISQIRPWVSRIDWCEGHKCSSTYMVVRLSDIRAKTGKNFFVFLEKSAILNFFLQKKNFFFASFSWKSVQIHMVDWMGQNFDIFPGFQQFSCYA